MIKVCKKCGSKELYLEPRIKGQDCLTTAMVALKCKDCGCWIKWCPKDERKYYLNKQSKDKWQKLKEFIKSNIEFDEERFYESGNSMFANYVSVETHILEEMEKLEKEDEN
ncbi:MAG TPA: hypothetical protein IAC46_01055 [Candidatus Onthoplasma faecigallinarum]|nr:hypothetical protein [Candidatus Onthoplasma faecigallinarum]